MKLTSSAVVDGVLQDKYGIRTPDKESVVCGIPQLSFPLAWDEVPEATNSFALECMDYDNTEDEGVIWIHWLVSEINGKVRSLAEGASADPALIQGATSWKLPYGPYADIPDEVCRRYGGPSPDGTHQYEVTLYALSEPMKLKQGFYYKEMRRGLKGKILDQVTLAFNYG